MKKKNLPDEDVKISTSEMIEFLDKQLYHELCRLTTMKPLVDTLYEYNIKGTRAVSFVFKFMERSTNNVKEDEDE